jgi:hypothetical protein
VTSLLINFAVNIAIMVKIRREWPATEIERSNALWEKYLVEVR